MPNWWTVEDAKQAADLSVQFVGGDSVVFNLGVTFHGMRGAWRHQPSTRLIVRCYDDGEVTLAEETTC